MAVDRNFLMKYFNGTDYDSLYPKTKGGLVDGAVANANALQGYTYQQILDAAYAQGAKIQTGSYVGTGTYGASNPCSLTFDFSPFMFWMFCSKCIFGESSIRQGGISYVYFIIDCVTAYQSYKNYTWLNLNALPSSGTVLVSYNNKTLKWYSDNSDEIQLNEGPTQQYNPNETGYFHYYWIAFA